MYNVGSHVVMYALYVIYLLCPMMNAQPCSTLKNLSCVGYEFKIVHAYTKCSIFNSLSLSCNTTRGHCFKLNSKRVNKNLFKCYFTNRIVYGRNSLPDHCFNTVVFLVLFVLLIHTSDTSL
jgi:hypothetical protein